MKLDLDAIKARCEAVTTRGPGYSDSDGDTEFLIYARADVPALVAEVERAQEENRVKGECLELAMKALRQYAEFTVFNAQKTVAEIEVRLAQLEPEEETR